MVRGLLERREHEDAVLHLRHSEARDAEHLPLVRHHVRQEHGVTSVDRHAVRFHRVVDLLYDAGPRRLDAQSALSLHDVVGGGVRALDSLDAHHRLQVGTLHHEVVLPLAHVVDHGARHAGDAPHDDVGDRGA